MAALNSFFRADWAFKRLLLEVWVLLALGRLSVLLFPFRKIASWMGESNLESAPEPDPIEYTVLVRIASSIEAASKYTFWNSNCFAQALCAHWILKRKRISHTIYFGLREDKIAAMKAHAWLRVGNKIVTGKKGHKDYSVIGKFAHQAISN